MRSLLFVFGIFVAMTGVGTSAQAQNYQWCANYGGGMGGSSNCGFVSFDQCMETSRGVGGFCDRNPQYLSPSTANPGWRARQKSQSHS